MSKTTPKIKSKSKVRIDEKKKIKVVTPHELTPKELEPDPHPQIAYILPIKAKNYPLIR